MARGTLSSMWVSSHKQQEEGGGGRDDPSESVPWRSFPELQQLSIHRQVIGQGWVTWSGLAAREAGKHHFGLYFFKGISSLYY